MSMFSKAQETVQKAVSSATGSNKPDLSKWNTEEMLETTLDEHGNPVPNASYTDYEKLSRGRLGDDEADAYIAATKNFRKPAKDFVDFD